jgi:tetratricopeptide (TPR) repeat protein
MIASGKVAPADLPRLNFSLGSLAYDARDFKAAQTAIGAAVAGGYRDNSAPALLADAYIIDNQVPQGMQLLKKAIADEQAAGRVAPANWYRRGLGVAYTNKLVDDSAWFSMGLVENYPTKDNWSGAISILREVADYGPQETLDLMRLMDRTGSFTEGRDYVEYIEAADGRRSPGEVIRIIKLGVAAGKLQSNDVFVSEQQRAAESRLAADQASLPSLERDARAASASATTVMAAADALLSYGQAAKAAELYQIALGKPGIDQGRALTRLGIAQVDLNQPAEAQATFAKVTGPRKPMVALWSLYAKTKGKPIT